MKSLIWHCTLHGDPFLYIFLPLELRYALMQLLLSMHACVWMSVSFSPQIIVGATYIEYSCHSFLKITLLFGLKKISVNARIYWTETVMWNLILEKRIFMFGGMSEIPYFLAEQ